MFHLQQRRLNPGSWLERLCLLGIWEVKRGSSRRRVPPRAPGAAFGLERGGGSSSENSNDRPGSRFLVAQFTLCERGL